MFSSHQTPQSHKFQNRSSPCVYLGVSSQHKGHKCLGANGRVYVSKDVVFHELQFPYSSPAHNTPIHNTETNQQAQSAPISQLPNTVECAPILTMSPTTHPTPTDDYTTPTNPSPSTPQTPPQ
ncbi:retrovirus-related pol polyprotein from transposon TNT 1-94 [Trifolium medium]|uniref:Retrovirus-related pol polyprotein from transposon TNT 1-94 n=1 Tax=Trifolium medium TaxID=97028 RepID=A0A392NEI3_9FABA|nr:retrovirus-related pol polyprotein from transposon TNT 1-94 [Trifolium medium]